MNYRHDWEANISPEDGLLGLGYVQHEKQAIEKNIERRARDFPFHLDPCVRDLFGHLIRKRHASVVSNMPKASVEMPNYEAHYAVEVEAEEEQEEDSDEKPCFSSPGCFLLNLPQLMKRNASTVSIMPKHSVEIPNYEAYYAIEEEAVDEEEQDSDEKPGFSFPGCFWLNLPRLMKWRTARRDAVIWSTTDATSGIDLEGATTWLTERLAGSDSTMPEVCVVRREVIAVQERRRVDAVKNLDESGM